MASYSIYGFTSPIRGRYLPVLRGWLSDWLRNYRAANLNKTQTPIYTNQHGNELIINYVIGSLYSCSYLGKS